MTLLSGNFHAFGVRCKSKGTDTIHSIFNELTFCDLQILRSLLEEKSLRSVARINGMEPTFLSKRIARLESVFGFEIIKRSPRGFLLTGEGAKLAGDSATIFREADRLFFNKEAQAPLERVITLGTRGFLNLFSAAPMIEASRQLRKPVRLRFIDMSPEDLRKAAFENAIEMGIHFEKISLTSSWTTEEVGVIEWFLFARTGHPLGSQATIQEVLKFPFVGSGYWTGEKLMTSDDGFSVPWRHRTKGHEVQTALTALKVIKTTDQLVYLPSLIFKEALDNKEIKLIQVTDAPQLKRTLLFSVHSDKITRKEQTIFSNCIRTNISSVLSSTIN